MTGDYGSQTWNENEMVLGQRGKRNDQPRKENLKGSESRAEAGQGQWWSQMGMLYQRAACATCDKRPVLNIRTSPTK
jgi:hypothetical protein